MGIAPDIWGPSAWQTIHLFCLAAPEVLSATDQLHYTTFFKSLAYVLPCGTCATHYQEHLVTFPIESSVATRESLFEWSVNIHNSANQMLGKPILSLEEAKSYWSAVIAGGGRFGMGASASAGATGVAFNGKWIYGIGFLLIGFILGGMIAIGYRTRQSPLLKKK
jgi:hypothetical protein